LTIGRQVSLFWGIFNLPIGRQVWRFVDFTTDILSLTGKCIVLFNTPGFICGLAKVLFMHFSANIVDLFYLD